MSPVKRNRGFGWYSALRGSVCIPAFFSDFFWETDLDGAGIFFTDSISIICNPEQLLSPDTVIKAPFVMNTFPVATTSESGFFWSPKTREKQKSNDNNRGFLRFLGNLNAKFFFSFVFRIIAFISHIVLPNTILYRRK
ncbi:hypothetical protein GSF70_12790 [Flavobacteriaceae bacterium W22]|nr:hypothetical protein [Flavobacteriaceae bacterium W22]